MSRRAIVSLWALYCLLDGLLPAACTKLDYTVGDRHLPHSVLAEMLQCFNCRQNIPGCLSFTNISHILVVTCRLDQPHCMVRRVESRGKTVGLERRCASTCVPGCVSTLTVRKCTSCCNTSRCNTDSAAWRPVTPHITWILIGLLYSVVIS